MKKIKAKRNTKLEPIMEMCKVAADYFWVYQYEDEVSIELIDDDNKIKEIFDSIRQRLTENNIYKMANDNMLRKVLRENYPIIKLFYNYDNLENTNDHSWDNAEFNGGN